MHVAFENLCSHSCFNCVLDWACSPVLLFNGCEDDRRSSIERRCTFSMVLTVDYVDANADVVDDDGVGNDDDDDDIATCPLVRSGQHC